MLHRVELITRSCLNVEMFLIWQTLKQHQQQLGPTQQEQFHFSGRLLSVLSEVFVNHLWPLRCSLILGAHRTTHGSETLGRSAETRLQFGWCQRASLRREQEDGTADSWSCGRKSVSALSCATRGSTMKRMHPNHLLSFLFCFLFNLRLLPLVHFSVPHPSTGSDACAHSSLRLVGLVIRCCCCCCGCSPRSASQNYAPRLKSDVPTTPWKCRRRHSGNL